MCKPSKPKAPTPAAQPAATVQQDTATGIETTQEEGINTKRKKGKDARGSLRIDVNVAGVGGKGLNIPR